MGSCLRWRWSPDFCQGNLATKRSLNSLNVTAPPPIPQTRRAWGIRGESKQSCGTSAETPRAPPTLATTPHLTPRTDCRAPRVCCPARPWDLPALERRGGAARARRGTWPSPARLRWCGCLQAGPPSRACARGAPPKPGPRALPPGGRSPPGGTPGGDGPSSSLSATRWGTLGNGAARRRGPQRAGGGTLGAWPPGSPRARALARAGARGRARRACLRQPDGKIRLEEVDRHAIGTEPHLGGSPQYEDEVWI